MEKLRNIRVVGLHIHLKSQILDVDFLEYYYKKVLDLAETFQQKSGIQLNFINLGSGIEIPYALHDRAIDMCRLGKTATQRMNGFAKSIPI